MLDIKIYHIFINSLILLFKTKDEKMKTLIKSRLIFYFMLIFISMSLKLGSASDISQVRQYEPVVLRGGTLSHFYEVPVDEIYLYAYTDSTQSYTMMPFQIDERILAEDPFHPGNENMKRHTYFLPDDGFLDEDDEIAFMMRDLGDKAPNDIWIDNEEAKGYERLEVKIYDPNDPNTKAYCYIFRSPTIQEEVPKKYGFLFHVEQDSVETNNYTVGLSKENSVIEDIVLKPPFGNGIDIFDRQKLRFSGVVSLGFDIPLNATEDVISTTDHFEYTKNPVVRLIKETRVALLTEMLDEMLAFYVTPRFYPFSATLKGGMGISEQAFKDAFDFDDEIWLHFDILRQSWDFNKDAVGMQFYNSFNDGVIIDGNADEVNSKIEFKPHPELPPIREWVLASGSQGSFFIYSEFLDTTWQTIELYFEDNSAINPDDTGDSTSYGDQGIIFQSQPEDSINLELGFTAYFLPSSFTKSDAEELTYFIENPIKASISVNSFNSSVNNLNGKGSPGNYELFQNYPNPFNSSTKITFFLTKNERVVLKIFDVTGRSIVKLADKQFNQGSHQVQWDGKSRVGQDSPSGVYFYVLESESFSDVKKMILMR